MYFHRHLHLRPGEVDEGHGGEHLEPGRPAAAVPFRRGVHPVDHGNHRREGAGQVGGRDRPAGDADPLLERVDVGRHVAADPVPGRLEDGGEHRDGRALSFRAGHVHDRHPPLRVAEGREQPADAGQAERAGARRGHGNGPLEVEPAVEPGQGGRPSEPSLR